MAFGDKLHKLTEPGFPSKVLPVVQGCVFVYVCMYICETYIGLDMELQQVSDLE